VRHLLGRARARARERARGLHPSPRPRRPGRPGAQPGEGRGVGCATHTQRYRTPRQRSFVTYMSVPAAAARRLQLTQPTRSGSTRSSSSWLLATLLSYRRLRRRREMRTAGAACWCRPAWKRKLASTTTETPASSRSQKAK
jgi:hypothetical protein